MSFFAPSRHFASRCRLCAPLPIRTPVQSQQRRTALFGRGGNKKSSNDEISGDAAEPRNPVLEEFRRQNPQIEKPGQQAEQQTVPQAGDIAPSSIFEDDRRAQEQAEHEAGGGLSHEKPRVGDTRRDPRNMLRVLDPDPKSRERWERKKIIQMVRRGGRLTKNQFIRRTEREHMVRSHNLKTSVKKLGMLARQIAGKNVEDAITQMRFSKKKAAAEVLKQLEFVRDEAVVMRGMGLGAKKTQDKTDDLDQTSALVSGTTSSEADVTTSDKKPIDIQLKDGKRHTVTDRSKMYIDQAWVGRGPYGKLADYRARGQVNVMRTPWTSISLVLKEEATRVREWKEREAKRTRRRLDNVWTPLPDRPIPTVTQRGWYSW